jgi:hypothetical protein
MSQSVGINYKSLIASLDDDASISEAFSMYHYGVENFTEGQTPSQNSLESHFVNLKINIDQVDLRIDSLGSVFMSNVSLSSSPNVISPESSSTVPLTIRSVVGQTASLQRWQNSQNANLAVIFSDGSPSYLGYLSVGATSQATTVAADIRIKNAAHKGITLRSASSQTENLQEWQNSSGAVLSRINNSGNLIANKVSLTGNQTLEDFTARNIKISQSLPSGGNDGDVWMIY